LKEVWKKIKGYDNYEISNLGRVKSLNFKRTKKEVILKNTNHSAGYLAVSLSKNGKLTPFLIHRIVASEFLDNNLDLSDVNHINGIKTDNKLNNLEWVNHSDNLKHAFKTGLHKETSNKIALNTQTGIFYTSMSEAAKSINISIFYLSMMINGKCKNKTNIIII
jgi:hypothetical protein